MTIEQSAAEAVTSTKGRKRGRPTDYTPELAESICANIADGISLRAICRRKDRPSKTTVLKWLAAHDEFAAQYARAREISAEVGYEEIMDAERRLQLPETIDNPNYADGGGEPRTIRNPIYLDPNKARVLIDSIKWRLSKLQPKVYGDRLELAGKVATEHVVDQAPDWLKQAIKDKTAEVAAERAAQHEDDPDPASTRTLTHQML